MMFLSISYEIFGIIFLFIILGLVLSIRIVPNKTVWLIERKKQFHRKLETGIHFIIPFFDQITHKISLTPFNQEMFFQNIQTKDEQKLALKLNCTCQIEDPLLYAQHSLSTVIANEQIQFLAKQKTLIEMRNNVEAFNDELYQLLDRESIQFGLKILKINIYYE